MVTKLPSVNWFIKNTIRLIYGKEKQEEVFVRYKSLT